MPAEANNEPCWTLNDITSNTKHFERTTLKSKYNTVSSLFSKLKYSDDFQKGMELGQGFWRIFYKNSKYFLKLESAVFNPFLSFQSQSYSNSFKWAFEGFVPNPWTKQQKKITKKCLHSDIFLSTNWTWSFLQQAKLWKQFFLCKSNLNFSISQFRREAAEFYSEFSFEFMLELCL